MTPKYLLAFPLLLAACGQIETETLAQSMYAAVGQYEGVKAEAAAFVSSGPLCEVEDVLGCVPAEVVVKIDEVTDQFDRRIDIAIAVFESNTATEDQQQAAISVARQGLRELSQTLNEGRN